mgnify:CR=1 FL=1
MKKRTKAPFAPRTIQEAYEARPRLWWVYTLILLVLIALLGWSGSAVHFKGLANKAKEKVKNEEGYARHKSLIPRRGRTVVAYTHAIFHSAFFENFSPKFGHTDPNFCFMLAKGEKE